MDKNTLKTVESFYPCNLQTDKTAALLIEIDGFKADLDKQVKSGGLIYVDNYERADGTKVSGYYRKK